MLKCNKCESVDSQSFAIVCQIETYYCNECGEPENFSQLDEYAENEILKAQETERRLDTWKEQKD